MELVLRSHYDVKLKWGVAQPTSWQNICAVGSEQRETSWLLSCHFGLFIYVVNCFVKYSIIGFRPSTHWNIYINQMERIRLLLLLETWMWDPLK